MNKKPNIVTVRLSDKEYEYLKNNIDFFYSDTISGAIRMCIRMCMKEDGELSVKKERVT